MNYSSRSYKLTKDEFNYLLPAIRRKLHYSNDNYYFIDKDYSLEDILNRLKGLYDNYTDINNSLIYRCFKNYSIEEFRDRINKSDRV